MMGPSKNSHRGWSSINLLLLGGLLSSTVDAFVTKPSSFLQASKNVVPSSRVSLAAEASASEEKLTIQILMSDTGGGHRASANALRDAFDELHPGKIECDIVDIFTDYGPFYPFDSFVPIYQIMQANPILWDIGYHFAASPFGLFWNEFCLELFCFEPFKKCMQRPSVSTSKRADMVVSVHPLTQDIPLKVLNDIDSNGKSRDSGRTTPFVTVVTDLGSAHPTWFNPNVDTCFVPSDALYEKAQERGLKPSQLVQRGLPIRRGFWADTSGKEQPKLSGSALRNELGLLDDVPTVLIVGGGDGMGGIIEQARTMGEQLGASGDGTNGPSYQMVVVCGKNEKAKNTLSSDKYGSGVSVNVKGFVNNMDEWMRASDVLVTKAGPGTIAEASICGLPCMLSSFLPGQEAGNIPFVEDAGFGAFSGDPKRIAETVKSWLSQPEKLATMKTNALEAARPTATVDIARDLADILFAHVESK